MSKENRINSFHKVDELTKKRGITFYALAKELGFSSVVFSDWKAGRSVPKADKLIKIADYFGVTVEYLIS